MLNQIEARFSDFVSQFAPASSSAALDARLRLLERQGRSAAEEAGARSVEAQLFTDPVLLKRAKDRLALKPVRLARHICASLLTAAMIFGLPVPVHASEGSTSSSTGAPSQPSDGAESPTLLDILEELLDDIIEPVTIDDDRDPEEGTH